MNPNPIQKIQLLSNNHRTIFIIYEQDDGNNCLFVLKMTTCCPDVSFKIESNEYDSFVKKRIDEGYSIFCPCFRKYYSF